MTKMNAKPTNPPMSMVSFGTYGSASILVPAAKLGDLINLLACCKVVTNEWSGSGGDYVDVLLERNVEITLRAPEPLTRQEYEAIREAAQAEEAAAKAAKAAEESQCSGLLLQPEDVEKIYR